MRDEAVAYNMVAQFVAGMMANRLNKPYSYWVDMSECLCVNMCDW